MINRKLSHNNENRICRSLSTSLHIVLILAFFLLIPGREDVYGLNAKYIILMISDGWGAKHIEATNKYTGSIPLYQSDPNWTRYWMATFPDGGSYNPSNAWSNFSYALTGFTDSAAAATALSSGFKTVNRRVTVSSDGSTAFSSIGERAKELGKAVGAVSTVPVSHATPGVWVAHNDDRGNAYAIADEGLFGDPNTTGTVTTDVKYGGGHGPTIPPVDVLIGAGGSGFVSSQILTKLRNENGQSGKHVLVERQTGVDGGDALMSEANDPATEKLAGLFDQIYHNANGSGYNPENPTLSESALAAIKVLSRNPNGFVLMIEGGAVDWAAHANNMDQMIGEQRDYDNAVQTVIDWVNDPANDSDWDNTLVIVTGDHEAGYLTKNAGIFPDQPLGAVSSTTLAKEKIVSGTGGRRASWEDTDGDSIIDSGETVYWRWNSGNHSNSLIPLYTQGADSELFADYDTKGPDPVRGYYIDNTDVFLVMYSAISDQVCVETGSVSITPGQTLSGNSIDLTSIVTADNAVNLNFTVTEAGSCPAQINTPIITRQDTWKYDIENTGTSWKNTGYDDSGWSTGNGIFGTEANLTITTPISNLNDSIFFRKTFTVCDPSALTGLTLNALFDDGIAVYINGTQVYIQNVTGNPPLYNGGVSPAHEATAYEAKDLTSVIGLNALRSLLVAGSNNVIAVGLYNQVFTPPNYSSDIVWDGELIISSNETLATIYTGDSVGAQAVDTTGWIEGVKSLKVTADDAVCLTQLPSANGSFTYSVQTSAAGITVTPTSGLVTTEAGGKDSFSMVLNTKPVAKVFIFIRSSDTTEGRISPSTLTFTPENWDTPQKITVKGVDDSTSDGNKSYTIITQAAMSTDSRYNGINPDNVSVTNIDNDNPGIKIEPSSGLRTDESGNTASIVIKLNSQPAEDVVISFSTSDTTEGTVFPSRLTFTPGNWDIPEKITIKGVDDFDADGDQTYIIVSHAAVSSDPAYNGLDPDNVSVINNDNEAAGITVTPASGLVTTEAGGKDSFSIVLNTKPAAKVFIFIRSSDISEGRVSPSILTFTPENWDEPQKITVKGVDDYISDGSQYYTIITHAAMSTDSTYNGIDPNDVSVINNAN